MRRGKRWEGWQSPADANETRPQCKKQGEDGKSDEGNKTRLDFHTRDYRGLCLFPLCAGTNSKERKSGDPQSPLYASTSLGCSCSAQGGGLFYSIASIISFASALAPSSFATSPNPITKATLSFSFTHNWRASPPLLKYAASPIPVTSTFWLSFWLS